MGRHEERPGGVTVADLRATLPLPCWVGPYTRKFCRDVQVALHLRIPAATLIARHWSARAVDDIVGGEA